MSYRYVGQQDDLVPFSDEHAEKKRQERLLVKNTIRIERQFKIIGIDYAQNIYYSHVKDDLRCVSMTNMNKLDFSGLPIIASDNLDRKFLVNKYNGHLYSINCNVYAQTWLSEFTVKVFIKSVLYHTFNIKIIDYNEFYLNAKWSVYNDTHIILLVDDTIHFIPFSLLYKEQNIDIDCLIKVKIPEYLDTSFYKLCNNYLLGKHGTNFSEIFKISISGLIRIHKIEPIYFEVKYFDSNYIILCKDSRIHIFQLSTKKYIVDSSTSFPEYIKYEEIYVNPINGRLIGTAKWNYGDYSKLLFISQLQLT